MIAGAIVGFSLFVAVGMTVAMVIFDDGRRPPSADGGDPFRDGIPDYEGFIMIEPNRPEDNDDGGFFGVPARTNVLLVGLDQNTLADAIMAVTFYRDTGDIHMMSIPRDMLVRIPTHRLDRMRADGLHPPHTLKVNAMRSHGGLVHGIYYLQEQLEEMLGVEFDFYVEINLAAFRRIVDIIGPIEMYIPRRLWYQDTTANPPLIINVPPGLQQLDGAMAEGVVRYRQWPMGDLDRINMQMEFMTLVISQLLTREALLADPLGMINIVLSYVRTDVGLSAALYVPLIPRISAENIRTFTMPGRVDFVGNVEYFIPCVERLPAVITEVFFNTFEE